ncbi:MAG TPA: hypothetical protein VHF58_06005 [Solirubrobacterales bacterium]|nr:hypothetical protein [Solirubrobacterales bacterium]
MRLSRPGRLATLAAIAALGLAGCGDDDDAGAEGDAEVVTAAIDGSTVLVDAGGRALYTSDQESGGEVACTGGCAAIWTPVEADGGSARVDGAELGVVERPDGSAQLTLDGAPLYSFAEEGPGELTGDGLTDSFRGREFTWSAAIVEAAADSDEDAGAVGGYGGY